MVVPSPREGPLFIRNCWYVIAWEHEVPADRLFTRTVIGEPVLLYRKADGTIVALEDRCCHRHAPLSKGRKEGECVRCGYHGLELPATETTTHYFFQQSHPAGQGDAALAQIIYDSLVVAFHEDRAMITAQARNIALNPNAPMVPLAMDAALTQFRRLVSQTVEAERAGSA